MPTDVLGIDIGGGHVRCGIVTPAGRVLALVDHALPPEGDPEKLAGIISGQIESVQRATAIEPARAGIAIPGIWDRSGGVMQKAVNLPRLEGVNLHEYFGGILRRPFALDADVNAAAFAQWGNLQPRPERFLYLSLGTGIGGAIIINGDLLRHTRGGAGHFGFLIVETSPDAPAGRNRVPGCLSAYAAGPALREAAHRCSGGGLTGSPGDLSNHFADALPPNVIKIAAEKLSIGLLQLVHIYAPEVIALGGGVIDHHPELLHATASAFERRRSMLTPHGMKIIAAPLSTDSAGVIGAAALATQHWEKYPHY